MIVVDIETTGTEPSLHSIVSIGALELEKPENQFYGECKVWEGAAVQTEALAINGFSEDEIRDPSKQSLEVLMRGLIEWAENADERTFGGQNIGAFDLPFLRDSSQRYGLNWIFPYRSIDVHSLAFMHLVKAEKNPPVDKRRTAIDSAFIQKYVGIPEEPKPHNALNGAKVSAEAISRLLYDKKLLSEFEAYNIPWIGS